jgi:hypothetical protein
MSGFNEIVELIKQMRGKIIEYLSNDCLGCDGSKFTRTFFFFNAMVYALQRLLVSVAQ